MQIVKIIFKIFLGFLAIPLIFIGLFFGHMIFTLMSNGMLFWSSDDVIYENWNIRLPQNGEEIYYTDSGDSFHGDGIRYSVYKYSSGEIVDNAFQWNDKKDKNMEEEIKEVVENLKEEDGEISEEYKINFSKRYEYIRKDKDDNSKLYLIHIIDENRIYVIEDIY